VHGSRRHLYECEPWPLHALQHIEQQIGEQLPDQCRRWITRVGGGAGPGYGFSYRNADYVARKYDSPLPVRCIENVTHLSDEVLARFHKEFTDSKARSNAFDYLFAVRSYHGLLTLCEHGCGWDSYLIVAGPQRGRVVEDTAAMGVTPEEAEGSFLPGNGARDGHILPTFFEWFNRMIDLEIQMLPQHRAFRLQKQERENQEKLRS